MRNCYSDQGKSKTVRKKSILITDLALFIVSRSAMRHYIRTTVQVKLRRFEICVSFHGTNFFSIYFRIISFPFKKP